MRYALESVLDCLSSKFGAVRSMSNICCQTSSLKNQINIYLWGIRGKPKDIISVIKLREKYFSVVMVSS
jgi:hypothetical protein